MRLYYAPLACSLADHIALHEAGAEFTLVRVDMRTKQTESGQDFHQLNAKGYVPTLVLEEGEILTENIAVLDWLSSQFEALAPQGPMGRTRQLEALAFISTEIHRAFKPMWHGGTDRDRAKAAATVIALLTMMADSVQGEYLFGDKLSVADCYLFVMLLWAERFEVAVPPVLAGLRDRMRALPSVQRAMATEGLQ
ncbi:MAG: glutathione S-transferase [Cypionkella sp.]|uniref:glutathione S-transferase C-terminal domain-containing protein n=1 Tax=Cypionkella sp. TaxID=2811411 RepID=UPI0026120098|nr:glutathione S-transferase C-terminal domain-containing protein [Cypionkella sp.]MDB5657859.1 glutathione S-transferase [Cypionkella sp.]